MNKNAPKDIKFRHEFKYLCTDAQLAILEARLKGILPKDAHVGATGTYRIKSLYFDDYNDRCYHENEDGVTPREKFRIRIYENSPDRISLECKRKEQDKIYKSSCRLTMDQFEYLAYGSSPGNDYSIPPGNDCGISDSISNRKGSIAFNRLPPLAQKLQCLKMTTGMTPKVIVAYERTPYVYKNGNVRITFDRNITSSGQVDQFFNDSIKKRPILPIGMQLLEVKYDEYLPDHIYHALTLDNLQRTNFSKYYLCRKYFI